MLLAAGLALGLAPAQCGPRSAVLCVIEFPFTAQATGLKSKYQYMHMLMALTKAAVARHEVQKGSCGQQVAASVSTYCNMPCMHDMKVPWVLLKMSEGLSHLCCRASQ